MKSRINQMLLKERVIAHVVHYTSGFAGAQSFIVQKHKCFLL